MARLLAELRSGRRGLTQREAARRLSVSGRNVLAVQRRRSPWRDLGLQLTHPLALLLWAAAGLSWVTGSVPLAGAIVIVIVLNAALAFVQERQGERAVEALQAYLPPTATVVRDGRPRQLPASELVPGDVVVVSEGDRISADGRVLEGAVEVDTSTLTGEALPALRTPDPAAPGVPLLQASDMVFSGTMCTAGQAHVLVVRTGMQTELGRIAALSQRVEREPSPLERQVRRVAWLIALVAVVAGAAFIPIGALFAGLSLGDAASFAIGLLVANVPEGLLPTITLALAVGVRELARSGALVKRLSAVETLGSTSVICTDKTGTLTQNRMSAVLVWTPAGDEIDLGPDDGQSPLGADAAVARLAEVMARCNTADPQNAVADPTDVGLLRAAQRLGTSVTVTSRVEHQVGMFHFDPQRRLMTTVDRAAGGALVVHTKGAPEEVLRRCGRVLDGEGEHVLAEADTDAVLARLDGYAAQGLRLIAAADRSMPVDRSVPADRFAAADTRLDPRSRDASSAISPSSGSWRCSTRPGRRWPRPSRGVTPRGSGSSSSPGTIR